ncbi:recombinase family protein [Alteribacillus sp. HJP-4]|uniref:recombinase family protein n=1 Tax=Alteribacillus sp. HJP-4 TaxID=2775394 RepID=UPI0035CD33BC
MIYGYSRVSSKGQNLQVQIDNLKEFGCEKIFKEKISGRSMNQRKQFNKLLDTVSDGDTIVVTKLDRFARSTKDALNTIDFLNNKGVFLVVLNMGGEKVDTRTPIGKFMVTMLAGVAEFEADMIRERQLEGIEKAKERGVYKGRPKTYTNNHKGLESALDDLQNRDKNGLTVNEICETYKISRATLYREARKK